MQSFSIESWQAFLVCAFNKRIDEVNDPRYASRFERFLQTLPEVFENKSLFHIAKMMENSIKEINNSQFKDHQLDSYYINNQILTKMTNNYI